MEANASRGQLGGQSSQDKCRQRKCHRCSSVHIMHGNHRNHVWRHDEAHVCADTAASCVLPTLGLTESSNSGAQPMSPSWAKRLNTCRGGRKQRCCQCCDAFAHGRATWLQPGALVAGGWKNAHTHTRTTTPNQQEHGRTMKNPTN